MAASCFDRGAEPFQVGSASPYESASNVHTSETSDSSVASFPTLPRVNFASSRNQSGVRVMSTPGPMACSRFGSAAIGAKGATVCQVPMRLEAPCHCVERRRDFKHLKPLARSEEHTSELQSLRH